MSLFSLVLSPYFLVLPSAFAICLACGEFAGPGRWGELTVPLEGLFNSRCQNLPPGVWGVAFTQEMGSLYTVHPFSTALVHCASFSVQPSEWASSNNSSRGFNNEVRVGEEAVSSLQDSIVQCRHSPVDKNCRSVEPKAWLTSTMFTTNQASTGLTTAWGAV